MAELYSAEENISNALVDELEKIESELEDYKVELEKRKLTPDMLLSSWKEEENVGETIVQNSVPVIDDEKLKTIERSIIALQTKVDDLHRKFDQLDGLNRRMDILDDIDEELAAMKRFLEEKLSVDFKVMYQNLMDQMNVEAIKIYRNIQAVIVEENAKQNQVLLEINSKSDRLKRRMNHVMIISIISFVVSILVMIVQILPALGIEIF